jgi:hypothetical protein
MGHNMLFHVTAVFIVGFAFARSEAAAKRSRLVPNDALRAFAAATLRAIIMSSSAVYFGRLPLRTPAGVKSMLSSSLVSIEGSLREGGKVGRLSAIAEMNNVCRSVRFSK